MPFSALVIAIGTALGEAVLAAGAEHAMSEALTKAKEKLKRGQYEEIARALKHARSDVFAQFAEDEQRRRAEQVLDTVMNAAPEPLRVAFGEQIAHAYLLPHTDSNVQDLAATYRKMSSPAALVRGEVPNDSFLTAIFQAFFIAFREHLLHEPTLTYLREYEHLVAAREQVTLLEAIQANTARPVEDTAHRNQEYRAYLASDLKDLTLRGFAPQIAGRVIGVPLADVFVPMYAVEGRPALAMYAEEDLRFQVDTAILSELDRQLYRAEMEKRYAQLRVRQVVQRLLRLADLLQHPRVVVLGDPGMGKTILSRYITYALATGDLTHVGAGAAGCLPVLIRVALFAKALERDSTLHLVDYIEHKLLPKPELGRYLRGEIEAGSCLLLLDGLDEVTNLSLRDLVIERIQATVAAFGRNRFFVTSRIVGYDQSPLTREFTHATLHELSSDDQVRFVHLWYAAIKAEVGEDSLSGPDDLIDTLQRKPQLARIGSNPLMLTIIVLMHWRGVKLPERRVQIYQIATDTLIEYWTVQRGVEMDADEIKSLLKPIAHFILSQSVGGVIAQRELLPRLYDRIAAYHGCDQVESRRRGNALLRVLSEQSGLFLERGYDENQQPVYGFLHQTFGEYLAALYLADHFFADTFVLADYLHRDIWHEPLLLMVSYLATVSQPHVNQLLRNILAFPSPYDNILQRNALFAIECLVEETRIQPELRQELLDTLARLIHNEAPQVRDAALALYRWVGLTRHRVAAVQSLKRVYRYDDARAEPDFGEPVGLNVAIALLHLGEQELARPIVWPMSENKDLYPDTRNAVRKLRFEYWPEHAAVYLCTIVTAARRSIVTAGADLAQSAIGPIDATLAMRVLTTDGLRQLAEELAGEVDQADAKAALRWIAVLAASDETPLNHLVPAVVAPCVDLLTSDTPAHIRCFAAAHLLQSDYRDAATQVLQTLADEHTGQAVPAARALRQANALTDSRWQVFRDTAWMAQHYAAPQAIAVLLEAGDVNWALPAALHLLATCQPGGYHQERDDRLRDVVQSLLMYGHPSVGLAAARWLALLSGYRHRIDACELLLEHGHVDQAIPLLQFLAYESHDAANHRASQRLLLLKEAERVVPLLQHKAASALPAQRYEAALALALTHNLPGDINGKTVQRIELKEQIFDTRQRAYAQAFTNFCNVGLQALDTCVPIDKHTRMALTLGRESLYWLMHLFGDTHRAGTPIPKIATLSVLHVCGALFDLRNGDVQGARWQLESALTPTDQECSPTVRVFALLALNEAASADDIGIFVRHSTHANPSVRWAAVRGLSGRDVVTARELLFPALHDESASVRCAAARALGQVADTQVVTMLVSVLNDPDEGVRDVVKNTLLYQGELAVPPLLAIAHDSADVRREAAVDVLAQLHYPVTVEFFIDALHDGDVHIRRRAARALGFVEDTASMISLRNALSDEDSNVRINVVEALCRRGDADALSDIRTAITAADNETTGRMIHALTELGDAVAPILDDLLDHEQVDIQVAAINALSKVKATAQASRFIQQLTHDDYRLRSAAANRLGALRDRSAVPGLIAALYDTHSFVIEAAAKALGHIGDPAASAPLIEILKTPGQLGRNAAVDALGELGDLSALPLLVAMLGDEDEHVRKQAASVLGKAPFMGMAVRQLLACLADDAAMVRSEVVGALGNVTSSIPLQLFITALRDTDTNTRIAAARALGKRGDAAAIDSLLGHFLDPEEFSREAIADSLGRLGAIKARNVLETAVLPDHLFAWGEILQRVMALIHLNPTGACAVLTHRTHQFRWFPWLSNVLMGFALWRAAHLDEAKEHFIQAVRQEQNTTTLSALGHYDLEHGNMAGAASLFQQALAGERDESVTLLSYAIVLWMQNQGEEAARYLRRYLAVEQEAIDGHSLCYDHFWGTQALAALAALQAHFHRVSESSKSKGTHQRQRHRD